MTKYLIPFITLSLFATTTLAQDSNNQEKIGQEKIGQEKVEITQDVPKSALLDKIEEGVISNSFQGKLTSLMFDDAENEAINRALDSFANGNAYLPEKSEESEEAIVGNKKSYIYLASIMYLNEKYWAVWINGEKITSENNKPGNELYLRKVQKDKISVLWTISASKWKILIGKKSEEMASKINSQNQVEIKFELKPNQTYLLVYNDVIEGNAQTNDSLIQKEVVAKPSLSLAPAPTTPSSQ